MYTYETREPYVGTVFVGDCFEHPVFTAVMVVNVVNYPDHRVVTWKVADAQELIDNGFY